uniref:PDZ domain-containing protein n=1 Tax=Odontella aurita TaxID=265563 RepID=A0A7S4JMY6_9STRA|mmetsp:Transcript_49373/g.148706  ORF Transcript_49373/g.148706 Transcript_49373/m.148706 type:complete len:564 (+) Transcript_49373:542-2233(+)
MSASRRTLRSILLLPLLLASTKEAGAFLHPAALSSSSLSSTTSFVPSVTGALVDGARPLFAEGSNDDDDYDDEKKSAGDSPFAVRASELDADLSAEERTTINVFRTCGPSVAYVTSVMNDRRRRSRRRRGGRRSGRSSIFGGRNGRSDDDDDRNERSSKKRRRGRDLVRPEGSPLGSGSGFVVTEDGYLVTNYHVVRQAHRANAALGRYNDEVDGFVTNATKFFFGPLGYAAGDDNGFVDALANRTRARLRVEEGAEDGEEPSPRASVYVRINSSTKYRECDIAGVRPDLDVAVLKIVPRPSSTDGNEGNGGGGGEVDESFPPIPYGPSSSLLVGQRLIAIGNPFGLDRTVTSGVVSALDREMESGVDDDGGRRPPIRGVIQTDAAINPGNSGGPLLDTRGRLVGVNTAIVTTSGSNAGIGFAVPSDRVRIAADEIISDHRARMNPGRPRPGTMGADVAGPALARALAARYSSSESGMFVAKVREGSPAFKAGMIPLTSDPITGTATPGDRIMAVGGTTVSTNEELMECMRGRVEGEKVDVTLEDREGERRVIYVTLARKGTF